MSKKQMREAAAAFAAITSPVGQPIGTRKAKAPLMKRLLGPAIFGVIMASTIGASFYYAQKIDPPAAQARTFEQRAAPVTWNEPRPRAAADGVTTLHQGEHKGGGGIRVQGH